MYRKQVVRVQKHKLWQHYRQRILDYSFYHIRKEKQCVHKKPILMVLEHNKIPKGQKNAFRLRIRQQKIVVRD